MEVTRDISSGGVCFTSRFAVEVGSRIDYVITLSDSNPPVRIRCLGKVLRSPKASGDGSSGDIFEVAVTMERYQFVRTEELSSVSAGA
jgi:hypothetical protein